MFERHGDIRLDPEGKLNLKVMGLREQIEALTEAMQACEPLTDYKPFVVESLDETLKAVTFDPVGMHKKIDLRGESLTPEILDEARKKCVESMGLRLHESMYMPEGTLALVNPRSVVIAHNIGID
jgi:hypothetical protein